MNRLRASGSSGAAAAWVLIAILVVGILLVIGTAVVIVLPLVRDARTPADYESSAVGWLRARRSKVWPIS